ncbi:hypothetical protein ACW73L_17255 [Methylolobus aquaticus]
MESKNALPPTPYEALARQLWRAFRDLARADSGWTPGLPSISAVLPPLGFQDDVMPRVLEVHATENTDDFSTEIIPDPTLLA